MPEEEQVVEIKPVNPYLAHQIKATPPPPSQEEALEIKPPLRAYIAKIKTQRPIAQEDDDQVIEIKPANHYVNQIKTTQAPPTSLAPVDPGHQNEEKKIVEYYIPIIQDIDDDDDKVVYNPSKF